MEEQIIIELKEQNAENINNGEFIVNLKEDIIINEGDQINITQAYLDTVNSTSQLIVLPNDLTINFEFGCYVVNALSSTSFKHYYATYTQLTTNNNLNFNQLCDGLPYILCNNTPNTGTFFLIETISLYPLPSHYDDNVPNTQLNFQYKNLDGEILNGFINIEGYNKSKRPAELDLPVNVIALQGSFEISGGSFYIYYNYGGIKTQTQTSTTHYEPKIFKKSITIKAGNYNYAEFSQVFNDEITNDRGIMESTLNPPYTIQAVINPLLQATDNINSASGQEQYFYFVDCANHDNMFYLDNGVWYGTNLINLSFDDVLAKFYFEYLHFPIYNESASTITKIANSQRTSNKFTTVSSYSGIFFTNINTSMDTDTYVFMRDALGFDVNNQLITNLTNENYVYKTIGNANSHANDEGHSHINGYAISNIFPTINLRVGSEITSGFIGLDNMIEKTSATSFYSIPITDILAQTFETTTETTNSIYAINSIELKGDDIGYYIIDIDIGFQNNLITSKDKKKNIYGLVSRYYSLNSYTTLQGSELVYIHKGASQKLSRIGVKILDSNYNAPVSIGNDTTIYLQIIKTAQQETK